MSRTALEAPIFAIAVSVVSCKFICLNSFCLATFINAANTYVSNLFITHRSVSVYFINYQLNFSLQLQELLSNNLKMTDLQNARSKMSFSLIDKVLCDAFVIRKLFVD